MPDARISDGTCSTYYYFAFNYFISISYILIILMLCCALVLLVRARQSFHPIFSTLLILLVIGYVMCNCCYVISMLLKLYKASSMVEKYFDAAYEGFYTYIGCIAITCLLERTLATVCMETYEQLRPWHCFIGTQIVSVSGLFTQAYMYFHDSGSSVFDLVLFCLSIVVVMLLVLLFFTNRQLVLSFRGGRRSLSTRYQLVENVRALRLFVPIIILDTIVSILDSAGSEFFGVEFMFEARKCPRKYYVEANLFIRPISIIAEALIPIMAVRHEALYKKIPKLCCARSTRIDSGDEHELNTIRNVFGMDIQGQTGDYVEQLRQQWS